MAFLNETGAFSCLKSQKKANIGIYYNERWSNKKYKTKFKNSKVGVVSQRTNFSSSIAANMKLFYQCKLYGVCEQFAKFEVIFLRHLGIRNVKYVYSGASNHAWTEMDVRSDTDIKDHIKCDYCFFSEKSKTFYLDQESPFTLQHIELKKFINQKQKAYRNIIKQLEQIQFKAPSGCNIYKSATIISALTEKRASKDDLADFDTIPLLSDFFCTASYITYSYPGYEDKVLCVTLIWINDLNCWAEYEVSEPATDSVLYHCIHFDKKELSEITNISQLETWQRTYDQNGNILRNRT